MIDAVAIPLSCGKFIGANVPTYEFLKPSFGGDKFVISAAQQIRTISSTSSLSSTNKDLLYVSYSGASTITDYHINIDYLTPEYGDNITIYSTNSGVILGPDNLGNSSGISTGSATLIAISNGSFSSTKVNVISSSGVTSSGFSGYASGSLANYTSNAIDTRISGIIASTGTKYIFSTQNHSASTYIRNSGCWTSGLDLTCISPWNSDGVARKAGTLISPRHIIFAAHYQINNGSTIRFVDANNNVVTRTMTTKLTHPSYSPYYPDITIGVLDSDVPASIGYARILPQNWANYLPSLGSSYPIPCLMLDQEEKALVTELINLGTYAIFDSPSDSKRLSFFEMLISGDSGDPIFLIINNQLVILTVATFGNAGMGTSILYHKNTINSMMSSLGGGYSLSEIDLSSFSYFS